MIRISIHVDNPKELNQFKEFVKSLNLKWKMERYYNNSEHGLYPAGALLHIEGEDLLNEGHKREKAVLNSTLIAEIGAMKGAGKSFGQIATKINESGIKTANGKKFYRATVQRLYEKYLKEQNDLLTKK